MTLLSFLLTHFYRAIIVRLGICDDRRGVWHMIDDINCEGTVEFVWCNTIPRTHSSVLGIIHSEYRYIPCLLGHFTHDWRLVPRLLPVGRLRHHRYCYSDHHHHHHRRSGLQNTVFENGNVANRRRRRSLKQGVVHDRTISVTSRRKIPHFPARPTRSVFAIGTTHIHNPYITHTHTHTHTHDDDDDHRPSSVLSSLSSYPSNESSMSCT